ncbi:melanocortin receptor 5-like [Acropora millepora]|uniref:melanocortin receptor 5-like n=1 Tax=Acropora millepora TaxID=45264 RepID=UPI001CF1F4F3|nr:melanocortin receptor 5-like [Acropora millepora]
MVSTAPNTTTNHSSLTPYLVCSVPGISMGIQQKLQLIHSYFLCPLSLTIAACSFLGNLLFIVAVMRLRASAHPSLIYFCSLAVSDLIWTSVQFYRCSADYFGIYHCSLRKLVHLFGSIGTLSFCGTLSNLVIISRDRFRAISRLLWYKSHMTQSLALRGAIVSWLSSLITTTTVSPIFFRSIFNIATIIYQLAGIITTVFLIVSGSIIIACHLKMYRVSRDQRNNVPQCNAQQAAAALLRERKVAKTVRLIMIAFVISYSPPLVILIILLVVGYVELYNSFSPLFRVFITLNGLLNPMICFTRNENLRRSLRDLFRCWCTALQLIKIEDPSGLEILRLCGEMNISACR